jgi:hypothetical protein
VPLTLDLAAHAQLTGDRGAADYALAVHNRHRAAADSIAAAQVRLGRLLEQRANPAEVKPGDQMYLDASPQHSPPHQCAIARLALEGQPCVRRRRVSPPPAVLAAD